MSQLKLTADGGGGTVAIKGPASTTGNNAFELTVPGTASGTILTSNSSVGKILQVVQTIKTDTFTTTGGSTFTDVTGLTVTITPSSNSNKILIIPSISLAARSGQRHGYRIVRGSTAIGVGDSAGSRDQYTQQEGNMQTDAGIHSHSFLFLDSPATTSATTYKIQVRTEANSSSYNLVYINRSHADADNNTYGRSASSITALEVAA
tara:strand:+ start:191 stop:808 length:618 start_codon:yes stop_codon:yes gene_type:complete